MDKDEKGKKDTLPTEQEILRGHDVTAREALLRASGGAFKGASPVAAADQTMFAVKELLLTSLNDGEGALRRTILARLEADHPLVARHFGAPRDLLRAFLERVLAHEDSLADLVRETDACWGRMYEERPRFEPEAGPPAPDDPYTREGVRRSLTRLLRHLSDKD